MSANIDPASVELVDPDRVGSDHAPVLAAVQEERASDENCNKLDERRTVPDPDLLQVEDAEALLNRYGARLAVGAVYRVTDSAIGYTGSTTTHPYVIIGGVPARDPSPQLIIQRPLILACRMSWKSNRHGRPPKDAAESRRVLEQRRWVFSAADTIPGCERDGFFPLDQKFPLAIERLIPENFLGWLPLPAVEWLVVRATGRPLPLPYPPDGTSAEPPNAGRIAVPGM